MFRSLSFSGKFLAFLAIASAASAEETKPTEVKPLPKLAWAHYVSWGFTFDRSFDPTGPVWGRMDDRSTLGKWVGTNQGVATSTRTQVVSALSYGINGFTVDVMQPENYDWVMERMYRAAEGLPFYISLCVDGWHGQSVDLAAASVTRFLKKWGKHPNNYYVDGKPVIFIYATHRTPEECAEIVQKVKDQGQEAFWLIQPQSENTTWDDSGTIARYLKVFDGLYDFGSNGISPAQMKERLANGERALIAAKKNPPLLVGGITQGYIGGQNGFYRPFLGTGTFRQNWQAVLDNKAVDWVCLTTWNDFWETTHFEPSVWGRDTLLRLNQEYLRVWRGEPMLPRPPQVFLSYKSDVRLGDDWKLEVLGLPYSTDQSECLVKLVDLQGRVIRQYDPIKIASDAQSVVSLDLKGPGFDTPRVIVPMAAVAPVGAAPESLVWKTLYPVTIRPGIMLSMRTVRLPLDELGGPATLSLRRDNDKLAFTATFPAYAWAGKAELLRNGIAIQSKEIAKLEGADTSASFDLDPSMATSYKDVFVVRFTQEDGHMIFTPPAGAPAGAEETVKIPVPLRGGEFDEIWGAKMGSADGERAVDVRSEEIYGFHFPMDDRDPRFLRDISGWNVVALAGGNRWGEVDADAVPEFHFDPTAPTGDQSYLSFNGKSSRIIITPRSGPHDVVTLEMKIRPKGQSETAYLFSDMNGSLDLGTTPDGKLFAQRGDQRVESRDPLTAGKWQKVAYVYDGKTLKIYVDGVSVGEGEVNPTIRPINSIGAIGCKHTEYMNFSSFYEGDMAGLAMEARALSPEEFQLK